VNEQLAIDFAATRRDLGIERGAANAGSVWQRRALGYVREFIALGNRGPFLCEDVRAFAEAAGLPNPPTKRAWGAVMRDARQAGLIRNVGYAPANSSNRSPKVSWLAS